jgi:hypothetical protein
MEIFIYLSLAVNIVVLVPIVVLMSIKSRIVDKAWGSFTRARGILMSIYLSILLASLLLIVFPVPAFVFALLLVQVVYKVTTPFTVGTLKNPVVISNLIIAALHIATLALIFLSVGSEFVPLG